MHGPVHLPQYWRHQHGPDQRPDQQGHGQAAPLTSTFNPSFTRALTAGPADRQAWAPATCTQQGMRQSAEGGAAARLAAGRVTVHSEETQSKTKADKCNACLTSQAHSPTLIGPDARACGHSMGFAKAQAPDHRPQAALSSFATAQNSSEISGPWGPPHRRNSLDPGAAGSNPGDSPRPASNWSRAALPSRWARQRRRHH